MSDMTPDEIARLAELRSDHYLMVGIGSGELEAFAGMQTLHEAIQKLEEHECTTRIGGGCCLTGAVKILKAMLDEYRDH